MTPDIDVTLALLLRERDADQAVGVAELDAPTNDVRRCELATACSCSSQWLTLPRKSSGTRSRFAWLRLRGSKSPARGASCSSRR